jgi:hypothetical protein
VSLSFEDAVHILTGMDVQRIAATPVDDLRKAAEARLGGRIRVCSGWSLNLVSHDEVEKDLDDALR